MIIYLLINVLIFMHMNAKINFYAVTITHIIINESINVMPKRFLK